MFIFLKHAVENTKILRSFNSTLIKELLDKYSNFRRDKSYPHNSFIEL